MSAEAVTVTEVRVLEGPNLYFARPAVKVSLECPGYLAAGEAQLRELGHRLGLRGVRPGAPDSDQRQRFAMRLVAHVVRLVAHGSGTTRLAVRTRTGGTREQVVVAFPWRWRGRGVALGESLGEALGALVGGTQAEAEQGIQAAVARVSAAALGARPVVVTPRIPVASVTGTNGKTTTTRLLAHIGDDGRADDRVELHRRRRGQGEVVERATTPARPARAACSTPPGVADRDPRDRPRRHAAQGHGGLGQRRQRGHQRLAPTTSACRASTPSTSSPRSRRSSPGSPSRAGSCSTATTRACGPCAPASRAGRGPSP